MELPFEEPDMGKGLVAKLRAENKWMRKALAKHERRNKFIKNVIKSKSPDTASKLMLIRNALEGE